MGLQGKEQKMKVEKGMTHIVELPFSETDKVIDGMELAEKTGDLESLKWCARMIRWLYDQAETGSTDTYCYTENLFNTAWDSLVKKDPPPALIAAAVTRDEERITGERAGRALDTLKAFFEESLPGKKLSEMLKNLESLRGAVSALAGEEAE
jgi:hypothetical protein